MNKKIIKINNIDCGSDKLFLISGPCVIEEESIMLKTAEYLKKVSDRMDIPVIYKSSFMKDNRSSVEYYSGPGIDEGLKLLQRIKSDFGFPIISDVHFPAQVKPAAEVLDIIQIPAYLCMQTTLVVEAAKTGKVINLKHGQFLAPEIMVKPIVCLCLNSSIHRIDFSTVFSSESWLIYCNSSTVIFGCSSGLW